MKCLEFYLSSLSDNEYDKIKDQIKPSKSKSFPLVSWDIFSDSYSQKLQQIQKKIEIDMVKSFVDKLHKNSIDLIFEAQDYHALVITSLSQKILWVNKGFTEMTGYSKSFAIDKTPRFLQGHNTSLETKQRIRNKLKDLKPFTEIVTNYKKDNSLYKCEVKIIPLFDDHKTHFLAIEKEIV